MNTVKIYISKQSIIAFIASILLLFFIFQIKEVLLLLFASFVISSALYPFVDWMSQKIPRGVVIAFVYLLGLIVLITLMLPFITVLDFQFQQFMQKFPQYWSSGIKAISFVKGFLSSVGLKYEYGNILLNFSDIGKNLLSQSIHLTINIFGGIATAFTLSVIVLFMLLDKNEIKTGCLNLFPAKYREKADNITYTISVKVGGYVRGQIILMFAVGLLTALGLQIIGLEFALLLGIIAGILEIIPIVGPVLSAVPAVIIGLSHSPLMTCWVIIVYVIVQRLENHFLTPLILGKFLEMHPIIIITAILVAANTLGVFGVILSPAIAACLYVLFQELYVKKLNMSEINSADSRGEPV